MIDNMLTGDAMAQQKAEGYRMAQSAAHQENMNAMQQQFEGMMNQNMMAKQFAMQQQHNMAMANNAQADLNALWDSAGGAQQMQRPIVSD
jgi:hypothetical protein